MIMRLISCFLPLLFPMAKISAFVARNPRMAPFHSAFDKTMPCRSETLIRMNALFNANEDIQIPSHSRRSLLFNTFTASVATVFGSQMGLRPASAEATLSIQYANSDDIMYPKEHGTSSQPVQSNLLYNVDQNLADKICNYNRHFAEPSGYFTKTSFSLAEEASNEPRTFYDSVTGLPLFRIPGAGRSLSDFVAESEYHGWPSFRDQEVVWENVRVLRNSGEVVSRTGTHLGHNLPDKKGNRYCINLVSIAGQPK